MKVTNKGIASVAHQTDYTTIQREDISTELACFE